MADVSRVKPLLDSIKVNLQHAIVFIITGCPQRKSADQILSNNQVICVLESEIATTENFL